MTEAVLNRLPAWSSVAVEQVKSVGLAVRRETVVLCTGLVVLLIGAPLLPRFGVEVMDNVPGLGLDPADLGVLAMLTGLVFPLLVWKDERRFGESEIWILPFDHASQARMKVMAGWVWLMGVVAFGVATISLTLIVLGGSLGLEETRLLATDLAGAREGLSTAITTVRWRTPAWYWILPFTSATGAYLVISALLLGSRRPFHWAAGLWGVFIGLALLGEDGRGWVVSQAVVDALAHPVETVATGAKPDRLYNVLLESGEHSNIWVSLPTFGRWAATAIPALVLSTVAVWAAAGRHREG